jgi:hypothetical protein
VHSASDGHPLRRGAGGYCQRGQAESKVCRLNARNRSDE